MGFGKKFKKEFARVVHDVAQQATAVIAEETDKDAVSSNKMNIVNDRNLDKLKAFLSNYNQGNVELLTKNVAGYRDSFLSFLFGKAVIEAKDVVTHQKPLSNPEVIGSLSLLLFTTDHLKNIHEDSKIADSQITFFLNKAINDKLASDVTRDLLEQMISSSKCNLQTDSVSFCISRFLINNDILTSNVAAQQTLCTLSPNKFEYKENPDDLLDDQEEVEKHIAVLDSYSSSSQNQESQTTSSQSQGSQTISSRSEDGAPPPYGQDDAPPPPYSEIASENTTIIGNTDDIGKDG